ncbi:hypothetical protein Moror_14922 [Moniliophthora roreri MCA 2997]|uniref:Reverse transcriptase-rnase h-integrase n=2 Tax=Moniliophthora roreri TaxID=221103 RepID=V2WWF9_MONRO|nr:hypothetical protein Moror_14922 [Moniliophthora roreri MCA 2997]
METGTPDPTLMTPRASSLGSPQNPKLSMSDLSPLPVRPPNLLLTTPSFILTPLPILMSNLRSSQPTTPLIEDPHLRPPLTPEVFRHLKHQFHPDVEIIPTVGREGPSQVQEVEDEEQENRTPLSDEDLLMPSLRPPTPLPTPMTLLVDCISALCVDWNAISPEIAHSTCVSDASRLNLDICLGTALTNEGLAALCTEGLVQVQTLCQMIAIMMMTITRISEESAEESIHNSRGDADFLFIGADPQKVQRFAEPPLVSEQVTVSWQPTLDVPATPVLRNVNEMPDTSYNYNTELYGDGES